MMVVPEGQDASNGFIQFIFDNVPLEVQDPSMDGGLHHLIALNAGSRDYGFTVSEPPVKLPRSLPDGAM
jgi:hypothetical protein